MGEPSRKTTIFTEELWSSVRVTIGFLVTSLIAQFGRAAISMKSVDGSKLLPFKNDEGHGVLGDLQCCRNVLVPFPRSVPTKSCLRALHSSDLIAWFLLWHALSTVGPYIDRCVPFQIMSNHLNLPQVVSNQVVETSQGWSMETGCAWAQFRVS